MVAVLVDIQDSPHHNTVLHNLNTDHHHKLLPALSESSSKTLNQPFKSHNTVHKPLNKSKADMLLQLEESPHQATTDHLKLLLNHHPPHMVPHNNNNNNVQAANTVLHSKLSQIPKKINFLAIDLS
jgi:hypothetical protein